MDWQNGWKKMGKDSYKNNLLLEDEPAFCMPLEINSRTKLSKLTFRKNL